MGAMKEYGCPRCGGSAAMEDFEARPVFNNGGSMDSLELVVESWCEDCSAASLFTDTVTVNSFVDTLRSLD
ncbi:MAG: hypothetical protein MAG715_01360 [Methanonatronarchaeales archaeon]|nr:hypothetical protein [Methanonatronarchaeales archaeon]